VNNLRLRLGGGRRRSDTSIEAHDLDLAFAVIRS
jgi:hypothetical protein